MLNSATSKVLQSTNLHISCDENHTLIAPCPTCGYTKTSLVKMPDGCKHWAARRCGECDRFLGWQPSPQSKERRQQQQTTINHLLQAQGLTDWEHEFLLSVRDRRSLSPKQQEVVTKIEAKVRGVR